VVYRHTTATHGRDHINGDWIKKLFNNKIQSQTIYTPVLSKARKEM